MEYSSGPAIRPEASQQQCGPLPNSASAAQGKGAVGRRARAERRWRRDGGRRLKCGKVFRERARKEGRDGDALARWGDVRRWILTGDSSVAAETGEVGN
jgi:hypothetical protein